MMAFVLALTGAAAVRIVETMPAAPTAAPATAAQTLAPAGGARLRVRADIAGDPFDDPMARFSLHAGEEQHRRE